MYELCDEESELERFYLASAILWSFLAHGLLHLSGLVPRCFTDGNHYDRNSGVYQMPITYCPLAEYVEEWVIPALGDLLAALLSAMYSYY